MNRLAALIAALTLAVLAAPTPAQAATSTCNVHILAVNVWSIQSDTATTFYDFKCGGANNEDYTVILELQWKDSGGAWHTFDCDNGQPCSARKPPTTGAWFDGGTEHSDHNFWSVAGQLDCQTIRFHGSVVFRRGSPGLVYNSITYHVGC